MPYKNPVVQFFGTQKSGRIAPAKVPYMELDRPSTTVNMPKRKQLETILDKEKRKEKRERVGSVLIIKLVEKFGSKNRAVINFFVEEFLNSHELISADDVNSLEKEIMNAINLKTGELSGNRINSSNDRNVTISQAPAETINLPTRPQTGSEWQAIQAYQSILGEEQERKEREKQHLKKMNFKKNLDDHLDKAKVLKNFVPRGEVNDQQYAQYVYKDIEIYHQQEAQKQAQIKKKYADELVIRQKQIQDHQRRTDEERENFRLAEERNLQRARDILARETEFINDKKAKEQERRRLIEQENEANKRRKAAQKQLDAENDQRLMREYAAKLDREQKAREDAFAKRMHEMEVLAFKFENDGAGKVAREEKIREDQLRVKEQALKEEMDIAKERKKEQDRQTRIKVATAENQRQLQQHGREAEEERARDTLLRAKFQRDLEEYKRSEEEKLRLLREKQSNYRTVLHQQMDMKQSANTKNIGISEAEKGMNMSTLREITADPQILTKVLHRVQQSTSSSPSKKH